jgi:Ser/Thr protein kinase RdoA (MazF antagonist)
MMKLRYLFENRDLAEMLLKNWEVDPDGLELLGDFRISANAIYPFRQNGQVCFLRCSPVSEKRPENQTAELDFIQYLRSTGYPALEPLPSKGGELLLLKETPWGAYYASAFRRVAGTAISKSDLADDIILAYGTALGQLHALSATYTAPTQRRWTHLQVFDWIAATLKTLPQDRRAANELGMLKEYFSNFPRHAGVYGLVHYDFETDNVFYDAASGGCSVIDFDDAMYHWYMMDITQALWSLKGELDGQAFAQKKAVFLSGYETQFGIDDDLLAGMAAFRRFANLYRYTRTLRTIQERWDNEPDWMVRLRERLDVALQNDSASFGRSIPL